MKHIKGGKLITNIVTQLLRKKVMLTQKIQIYSAHDISLVNLFRGLGIEDQAGLEPGYGAALSFELYDSNDECNDWILKVSGFRLSVGNGFEAVRPVFPLSYFRLMIPKKSA